MNEEIQAPFDDASKPLFIEDFTPFFSFFMVISHHQINCLKISLTKCNILILANENHVGL